MRLVTEKVGSPIDTQHTWPTEARSALFTLQAGPDFRFDRRERERHPMRTEATIEPHRGSLGGEDVTIYVKDVNAQFMGFIADRRLMPGTRGTLQMQDLAGEAVMLTGVVGRCREFKPGWFEGFVAFDEPNDDFDRAA